MVVDRTSGPSGPPLFVSEEEDLRSERYSVDQGLSQSGVLVLAQDLHGFLWIGTTDGLNMFDGHEFTTYVYDPAEPTSLPNNTVRTLHVDREGTLWVGTTGGLSKLVGAPSGLGEDGRPLEGLSTALGDEAIPQAVFTTYLPHPESSGTPGADDVRAIADDALGQLWIGTPLGLDRVDPESGVITHVDHDPTIPSRENQGVSSILVEGHVIWAATPRGLKRFDTSSGSATSYPFGDMVISHALRARSGQLWVAGRRGFGHLDETTNSLRLVLPDPSEPPGHLNNVVGSMLEDRQGTIWVGTASGGLVGYDPRTGKHVRFRHDPADPTSLGRAEIRALLEDRSGVLWVGTGQGGLNKTVRRTPTFVTWNHDPTDPTSISHDYITGISEGASGDVWIGTGGGGLNRLDRRTGRFHSCRSDPGDPHSLPNNYLRGILRDREGVVWVTTDDTLARLDPDGTSFSIFPPDPSLLGAPVSLVVVYEDRAGRLWCGAGIQGGGAALLLFDRETETFLGLALPDRDRARSIQVIQEDQSGTLWLGTQQGGLYAFDPATEQLKRYTHDPADGGGLRNPAVQSIYQDSRGDLWIGTRGGGLSRLEPDGQGFRHYLQADGLANDVVYGIVEDDGGLLWISTNRGLSRFDPVSGVFRNYDVTDGLQRNEFNRWAHLVASDGTIFFGGINGLTAFRPGTFDGTSTPPPVALTSVRVRNRVVATGRTAAKLTRIELPADQNFFSLEFVALDFSNPAQNQYAYWLDGFDDDWIQAGSRRYARYTNVGPGEYEFRLRAANNEGVWNNEGLSLAVTVLPPLWETWQFILLALASGASMVYALYRYRVRQLIRVERTRTRIARDIHDDLNATLSSISFFAHAMGPEV